MFETFDVEKLQKIARDISEKSLVQVEGATCSGKSTLLLAVYRILKQKGINIMILEEAAI